MFRKFDGLRGRLFIRLFLILRILSWGFIGFGEEASHNTDEFILLLKNIA
jgi:hypothetical protein